MGPEIHMEKCTGCGVCMQVCAEKMTGKRDHKLAVIQVIEKNRHWEMVTCNECGRCAEVCPADAISKDARGILIVDAAKCIGCGVCIDACPTGSMRKNPETGTAYKCVRCAGCVMSCKENVFQFPGVHEHK